jgi:hypothetical protein
MIWSVASTHGAAATAEEAVKYNQVHFHEFARLVHNTLYIRATLRVVIVDIEIFARTGFSFFTESKDRPDYEPHEATEAIRAHNQAHALSETLWVSTLDCRQEYSKDLNAGKDKAHHEPCFKFGTNICPSTVYRTRNFRFLVLSAALFLRIIIIWVVIPIRVEKVRLSAANPEHNPEHHV